MKVLYLLMLFVALAAARGLRCPSKDGRRAVLLPNPRSCSSFYICSNGTPIKQYCPKGLEFNPLLKVCDWPNRSLCSRKAESGQDVDEIENAVETELTSEVEEIATVNEASNEVLSDVAGRLRCPAKDGRREVLLPNPKSCSSFYICSNGTPIKQYCPKVRCPAKDGRREVLLPNPRSCSSFYICSNGTPIKQYCPKGLEFNPLLKVCDWPNRSLCSRKAESRQDVDEIENAVETELASEVEETATVNEASNEVISDVARRLRCPAKDGRREVLLPNPRSCSSFYICSNGTPIKQYCPKGLEFNPLLKVCDWPNRSLCSRKAESRQDVDEIENAVETELASEVEETATVNEASNEVLSDVARRLRCPAKDGRREVLLPNPKSCSSFYICSNGRPIKQYCPKGLEFNPLLKVCDWPNRSLCSRKAESEQDVDVIENADETKLASELKETATANEASNEVVSDVATKLRCPAKDGRRAVLLPNPKSCSSFYICSNGKPIKQYCPKGLKFNPLLKVCDWPNRSFCFKKVEETEENEE